MAFERPRAEPASLVHRGLGCVEFFDLGAEALSALPLTIRAMAAEGRPRFSFHSPLFRSADDPGSGVTCFFLSQDDAQRERSFRLLGTTLASARFHGAAYVVCHLTFAPSDTRDPRLAEALARTSCARMAELSLAYGIPIDVEFAAYSDAFHDAEVFADMVDTHPELGVCIDLGHVHLGARLRGRDEFDDVAALAPGARSMHLWNTRGEGAGRHVPLHPSQDPAEGWIDVERALALALAHNPDLNIVFEYPVTRVSARIQAGYDWIAATVERLAPARSQPRRISPNLRSAR